MLELKTSWANYTVHIWRGEGKKAVNFSPMQINLQWICSNLQLPCDGAAFVIIRSWIRIITHFPIRALNLNKCELMIDVIREQTRRDWLCVHFNKCSLDRSLLSKRQNCGSQVTYKNLRSCSWKLACQEEIWLVKHNKHTLVSGIYVTIIDETELTCQLCHLGDKSMIKPLCVDFIWRALFFPADRDPSLRLLFQYDVFPVRVFVKT